MSCFTRGKLTSSHIYFRLQNPFECPYNGSRRQDCACRNDYAAAGYTVFQRVRLDLSTMRIISESQTLHDALNLLYATYIYSIINVSWYKYTCLWTLRLINAVLFIVNLKPHCWIWCDCHVIHCVSATDVKFSQTLFGRSVPFASAGDCYSAAKCPQVPSSHVQTRMNEIKC